VVLSLCHECFNSRVIYFSGEYLQVYMAHSIVGCQHGTAHGKLNKRSVEVERYCPELLLTKGEPGASPSRECVSSTEIFFSVICLLCNPVAWSLGWAPKVELCSGARPRMDNLSSFAVASRSSRSWRRTGWYVGVTARSRGIVAWESGY
jgi:hypothetical protein